MKNQDPLGQCRRDPVPDYKKDKRERLLPDGILDFASRLVI
jgi:hypothetical protein